MEDDIIVSSQIPAVTTFSYDPSAITAFALVTSGGERYRYAYPAIHNLGWYCASCAVVFGGLAAAQAHAGTRRRLHQAGHPDNFHSTAARTYRHRHQPADDSAATNAVHGRRSKRAPSEPSPTPKSYASAAPPPAVTNVDQKTRKVVKRQGPKVADKQAAPASAAAAPSGSPVTTAPPTRLSFADIISGQLVKNLFNLN